MSSSDSSRYVSYVGLEGIVHRSYMIAIAYTGVTVCGVRFFRGETDLREYRNKLSRMFDVPMVLTARGSTCVTCIAEGDL